MSQPMSLGHVHKQQLRTPTLDTCARARCPWTPLALPCLATHTGAQNQEPQAAWLLQHMAHMPAHARAARPTRAGAHHPTSTHACRPSKRMVQNTIRLQAPCARTCPWPLAARALLCIGVGCVTANAHTEA